MKWAVCNEIITGVNLKEQCQTIKSFGFSGIEIAPFTIADSYNDLTKNLAKKVKETLESESVELSGFHWLISHPKSLSLVSETESERKRCIDALKRVIDFSIYLGKSDLTLGCPNSRSGKASKEKRYHFFLKSMKEIGEAAAERGTTILIEPLSSDQTDLINTFSDVRNVIKDTHSLGLSSMFDYHNTKDEKDNWAELAKENLDIIKHVHVNKMNGESPNNLDTSEYIASIIELEKGPLWFSLESFGESSDSALKAFKSFREESEKFFKKLNKN